MLEVLGTAGHEALVKPKPLRLILPGRHTLNDVAYDPDNGMLACPNAAVRRITPKVNVNSGAACRGLPLRDGCRNPASGRKSASTEHGGRHHVHRATMSTGPPRRARTSGATAGHAGPWSNAASLGSSPEPDAACAIQAASKTWHGPGPHKAGPIKGEGPRPRAQPPEAIRPRPNGREGLTQPRYRARENLPLRRNGWFGCQYTRTSHPNSA